MTICYILFLFGQGWQTNDFFFLTIYIFRMSSGITSWMPFFVNNLLLQICTYFIWQTCISTITCSCNISDGTIQKNALKPATQNLLNFDCGSLPKRKHFQQQTHQIQKNALKPETQNLQNFDCGSLPKRKHFQQLTHQLHNG